MINAVSAERGSDVHVEKSGMRAHSEVSNPINYVVHMQHRQIELWATSQIDGL